MRGRARAPRRRGRGGTPATTTAATAAERDERGTSQALAGVPWRAVIARRATSRRARRKEQARPRQPARRRRAVRRRSRARRRTSRRRAQRPRGRAPATRGRPRRREPRTRPRRRELRPARTAVSPREGTAATASRHATLPSRGDYARASRAYRLNVLTSSSAESRSVSPQVATPIPRRHEPRTEHLPFEKPEAVREPVASPRRPGSTSGTGSTSTTATSKRRPRRSSSARDEPRVDEGRQPDDERLGREDAGRDEVDVAPRVRRLDARLEHRLDEPVALRRSHPGLQPAEHAAEPDETDPVAVARGSASRATQRLSPRPRERSGRRRGRP